MPIQRDMSHIDDSINNTGGTSIPATLTKKEVDDFSKKNSTEFSRVDDVIDTGNEKGAKTPVIGRTYPDIIVENMNSPRVIISIFAIISLLIFASSIKNVDDLVLPLTTTFILSSIWFGITGITYIVNKFTK